MNVMRLHYPMVCVSWSKTFFFTSFRSLKVLRIARNVIVVDIVVLVCRYNSWNFGFGSGTNPYDYDYH